MNRETDFITLAGALAAASFSTAPVLMLALILLSGCAALPPTALEPAVFEIPIEVRPEPPPELLAPLQAARPVFVSPSDPAATSALTEEGERRLKALVGELLQRVRAWEAWGASPPD